jgi:Na+/citrate or Na+/malate symporter
MVSNEEIKKKIENKEEKPNNGHLICDKCQGSYELQQGEKLEDFTSECECGGNLRFVNNVNELNNDQTVESKVDTTSNHYNENEAPKLTGKFVLLIIFSVFIAGILFPIGPIIAAFIIWWIFFHKNISILPKEKKEEKSNDKRFIKTFVYLVLLVLVGMFYLSQASALFKSAFYGIFVFGGVVVSFLVVKYLLNR